MIHLDFETYCDLDIRKVGGHRYARHPSTEVLICSWMRDGDARPRVWLPRSQPVPAALLEAVRSNEPIGAHNSAFERSVWRYALLRQHPALARHPIADARWSCTAARAAASGLPRALDKALAAAGLDVAKDPNGPAFIKRFCKPRKPTKKDPRTRILPEHEPEEFAKGVAYCVQDVIGEAALHDALPDLHPREKRMFLLDMLMNDRGLPIDIPLVRKAFAVVQALEQANALRVQKLTGGVKATQVAKMLEVLEARGVVLENMQADTIKELLKGEDMDAEVRDMLELRLEAGKASTKKLTSMLACADPEDWVVQGGFLFHGAHTGRYAGRLVQPHNFIRGLLKERQRALVFTLLEYGDASLFQLLYDKPIDVISQCMRGFIRAPQGYELAVVDYTAIEARILAWLAGEEHMLEAYRQGVDVYKLMAAKLWVKDIKDVTDEERRIAKNLVLGCGYSLGGPRFVEYAANAGCIISEEFALRAVKVYRKEHPNIVRSWRDVESAAVAAIRHPGKRYSAIKCTFYMREHWLCIRLPSGREMRYPQARATLGERFGHPSYQISFRTEYHGQFLRETTYGGKLVENITQAVARDVMMEGMLSSEEAGYPVIGTVHDELLTLRKLGTSNIKRLERVVCEIPPWSKGIPLAAKGFVCDRYKKD